jgi:hypothetical protein
MGTEEAEMIQICFLVLVGYNPFWIHSICIKEHDAEEKAKRWNDKQKAMPKKQREMARVEEFPIYI